MFAKFSVDFYISINSCNCKKHSYLGQNLLYLSKNCTKNKLENHLTSNLEFSEKIVKRSYLLHLNCSNFKLKLCEIP